MGHNKRLHYHRTWLAIGLALVGFTIWFSLRAMPPSWLYAWGEQSLHAGVYALLVFWFGQIYPGAWRQVLLVLVFVAMGVALELLQAWLTTLRRLDGADMVANAIGAAAAWAVLRTPAGTVLHHIDRSMAGRAGRT